MTPLSLSPTPSGTTLRAPRPTTHEPPPDTGATEPSPTIRLLMVIALYAIPVLVAVRPLAIPVMDPDVWWHLRIGEWVVENSAVPTNDPLSQLDKPWVAYSWLFEVLLYGLYTFFGLAGVVVYRAALSLAVVAGFHRLVAKREPRFLVALGWTAAAALATGMLFNERPWLFTILFTTLTLDALLDLRAGKRSLTAWLLPLVFVLWANIHIQFVYGFLLLGLACVAPAIDACIRRAPGSGWWQILRGSLDGRILALTAACVLATLANPYHVRLHAVIVEYATQPGPFRFVNELKALEFREPCGWIMVGLAGWAAFALGRRKELSSFDVLLLAGTAALAFRARRDLWFLVLASLAILATGPKGAIAASARFVLTPRRLAIVAGVLLVLALLTGWVRGLSPAGMQARVARVFPVGATRHVRAEGYRGPLFNDFNWGGYLTWALPELPVAIDGRTNLHGDERIVRYGNVWAGVPGWAEDPDLCEAGVVIAPADSALAALLLGDPRFVRTYEGEVALVFVSRSQLREE